MRRALLNKAAGRVDLSNAELLRRCSDGDSNAWSEIVARYERLVYAIPLREGLCREDAADVAQDTFAALLDSVTSIHEADRLGVWLMTVARRLTWRRRNERDLGLTVHRNGESLGADPNDDLLDTLWVYEAVQSLGEPCSSVITSLFFDPAEPSYSEIALRLGRPIGSVGPTRSRCLERLRVVLETGLE